MTTKMIATRGDGVMRCCVVLLLLLLGVPPGQTQCVQKVTECKRLLMNMELTSLFAPPYNATALETACSSVRQNMTDCAREANESCSGQPDMLESLANSSTSLDSYCGPASICQLKATACQAAVLALLLTGPPSGNEPETTGGADLMQKLCPAYEQAAQCLQALTATDQCREVEAVKNVTSIFAMTASSCATGVPSGQIKCIQTLTECSTLLSNISVDLSTQVTPPYNVTAVETACSSARQTMTDCVREANESCGGQPDMLGSLVNASTSLDFYCRPGGQACPQSSVCFSAFMPTIQSAGQCTAIQNYVGCLSGLKGTCTFDESKITLTDLESLMTSVCTETLKYPAEYGKCSAVVQCGMTHPTLGLSALSSVDSTASQELLTIMTKLTDPAFLCSYLQVMVDCSVSQAQACQYNNQYVAFMKTQQQSLQPRCSKAGQNTGDGSATDDGSGGERSSGHAMHWVLTAVTSLTAALLFGL